MKRILVPIIALLLLAGLFSGCAAGAPQPAADDGLRVVCTIFPAWDWLRALLGERASEVELTLLLDSGVDLHSYQPTADDIVRLSACDLFVYVGGESDAWVADALKEATNKDMVVVDLMDVLGEAVREEELVEGMEAEEEEESGAPEYDEHVWLSLKNAETACGALAEALETLDPEHAEDYRANADAYLAALGALDADYQAAVDGAARRTLLFGDRFPFRYLADDYGLDYYAAFAGCSAETEASFETIAFLADKADELGLDSILTLDGSDGRIAETVAANTAAGALDVLTLDSMQSTTAEDVEAGATYLSIMRSNLDVLKAALN